MTIAQRLVQAAQKFTDKDFADPKREAQYLLCRALDCDRAVLMAHPDRILTPAEQKRFDAWLDKRLAFMPLAYICGWSEFGAHRFLTPPEVLIPRPDSETLLTACDACFPDCNVPLKIFEPAAGSGAIGLSLLARYPRAEALLSDISLEAIDTIGKNAERLGVAGRVTICQSDWMQNIPKRCFDLVIANPPYVRRDDIIHLPREVRDYEPHLALDGGRDGLGCYRTLNSQLPDFVTTALILEAGHAQARDIIAVMGNFTLTAVHQDLAGIDRALTFAKKKASQNHCEAK